MTLPDSVFGGLGARRLAARLAVLAACLPPLACGGERSAAGQVPLQTLMTADQSTDRMEWIGGDSTAGFRFRPFQEATADASRDVVVPAKRLVAWGHPAETGLGSYLVLVDGGVIAVGEASSGPESIQVQTQRFGERDFPLERARGVVFRSPSAAVRRDRLFDSVLAPPAGDRDRLTMLDGDVIVGSLKSLAADTIVIETALGPADKAPTDAATLVLNPALAAEIAPPSPRLLVGLRDGTFLVCTSVAAQGDEVLLEPAIVADVAADKAQPWKVRRSEVVFLQMIGGDARYLSDLEPTGYKHVPFLDRVVPYRNDRSVTGGRLRTDGRRYAKGVAMPSTSRLTFPLDSGSRTFQAEIAVDDDAGGSGSVTFRVFVDAEERYRSEIIRGGDAPRPVSIEVAGGKQLSLVVDFAEFGDQLDHADWLNARLVP